MKTSFYESYILKKIQENKTNEIEEVPKIRSPNKTRIPLSYYLIQFIRFLISMTIVFLAIVGMFVLINTELRTCLINVLLTMKEELI